MPNQDDINRAREGRERWNDWAAANAGAKVDFSGQSLDVFDFEKFIFPGDVNFSECQFAKNALFTGATFKGRAKMDRVRFHADAVFRSALFERDADMSHAEFKKHTDFRSTKFNGNCTLTNATCAGETDFSTATFGDAIFRGVQFDHPLVTFESATFSKVPDFRNSSFKTPPILFGIDVNTSTKERPAQAPDADKYHWLKLLASDAKDH